MEERELIQRLTHEFGYAEPGAQQVAEKLLRLTPDIYVAFEHWWRTGELPAASVEEYTLEKLIRQHGMNPVTAFLTLDWLAAEGQRGLGRQCRTARYTPAGDDVPPA